MEEIGRKVAVLGVRMSQSHEPEQDTANESESVQLEVEDMTTMQKVLDMFDVISQMVCDSEENSVGRSRSTEGERLMAEIVSLRAGQLALIQEDFECALGSVSEVKKAFSEIGYTRCHGLLVQLARQIETESRQHEKRQVLLDRAHRFMTPSDISKYQTRRGDAILKCAQDALSSGRFDHSLAFIVKAKRAFSQSDKPEMMAKLEELNRKVVLEATRMASDSLILEATRTTTLHEGPAPTATQNQTWLQSSTSRTASESESCAASDASTEANHAQNSSSDCMPASAIDAVFSPHDETKKIIRRIDDGGKVALNQEQDELEDEIQRLRRGLEASKSQLDNDVVPIHRKSATYSTRVSSITSFTASQHAPCAQESSLQDDVAGALSIGAATTQVTYNIYAVYGGVPQSGNATLSDWTHVCLLSNPPCSFFRSIRSAVKAISEWTSL